MLKYFTYEAAVIWFLFMITITLLCTLTSCDKATIPVLEQAAEEVIEEVVEYEAARLQSVKKPISGSNQALIP